VPQPHHRQQELVGHRQVEAVAAARGATPVGPVQAPAAVGGKGGAQLGQEVVEGRHRQAGQRPEDGRVLAEVFAAEDHQGLTGSCLSAWVQLS
jgi:hypothetical protein